MGLDWKKIMDDLFLEFDLEEGESYLHIFSGDFLWDYFRKLEDFRQEDSLPFREAFAVHELCQPVFSEEFVELRARGHGQSLEDYGEMVLKSLEKLLKKSYDNIILWFGEELFCSMNVLVLLTYMEESKIASRIFLNRIDEEKMEFIDSRRLVLGNYRKAYGELLESRLAPGLDPDLEDNLRLYLELRKDENFLRDYIEEREDLDRMELLVGLMEDFSYLGYGDRQYLELIDRIRKH